MSALKTRRNLSLLLITALAFALRVWNLGGRSLWLDEGDSVGFARMSWPAFLHVLNFREVNMAIYYLFLRGWVHLGSSEFMLRLPSALFGTAAVVATYLFAERLHSRFVAVLSALFLSFNVLAIRHSREVRGYGMALMLVSISWLAYERAVRRGMPRDVGVWIFISALAAYAHLFAGLVFVAQLACLLLAPVEDRKRFFLIATAGYSALILPLVVVVARMDQDPISWVLPLSKGRLLKSASDIFNGGVWQIAIALALLLAGVVLILVSKGKQRWAVSTAVLGAIVPLAITVTVSLVKPTLVPRYLVVALPSVAIALSIPLARLPRVAGVAAAVLVLALGLPLLRAYRYEPAINDFRAAVNYISQRAQPGDVLMVWEPLARPAVEYYASRENAERTFPTIIFPRLQNSLVAEDLVARPEVRQIDELCAKYRRIWILYDVGLPPERYAVWHAFFIRRASLQHRLESKLVIPAEQGVQVLEFERP